MNSRRLATVALVALAVSMSGCSAPPTPEETTPAFASEEEAFAAAEETYRAYVDALNQVDLSDPETFEPVYALTTGDANANERERLTQMHADRWVLSGSTVLVDFLPYRPDGPGEDARAIACMDVASVSVVDADGNSQVAPGRRDRYSLSVTFDTSPASTRITSSFAVEDDRCAL